jgi:hypothetical protein
MKDIEITPKLGEFPAAPVVSETAQDDPDSETPREPGSDDKLAKPGNPATAPPLRNMQCLPGGQVFSG